MLKPADTRPLTEPQIQLLNRMRQVDTKTTFARDRRELRSLKSLRDKGYVVAYGAGYKLNETHSPSR